MKHKNTPHLRIVPFATMLTVAAALPLLAADITPNPHQVTRILEVGTDTTLSDLASGGQLRKRGEGTLTLSAPGMNGSGTLVVEQGAVVLDLDAAPSVPSLPSSVTSKIALWLDATQNVVTDGSGLVVDWFDRRETNLEPTGTHAWPFASSRHQWVPNISGGRPSLVENDPALGGKPHVDFGPWSGTFAGGRWLCLTNTVGSAAGFQTMNEVFVVFAKHPDDAANLGCGTLFGGYYNGVRANPIWTGSTDKFYFSNSNTRADKGSTRLDRAPVWGGYLPILDTDWHLVSTRLPIVQNDYRDKWNLLGADRDLTSGGPRIAEIVVFATRLSDFDRMRVEEYLWRKWMGSRQTSVGALAVNAEAAATIQTDSDAIGDLTGGGTVVKTGTGRLSVPARDFTGTIELREGSVRSDGAAFAIAEGGQRITASAASLVTRTSESDVSRIAKDGLGLLKIASLPAGTTLAVENGTVVLAPPERSGVPVAATFGNADFEAFSPDVSDFVNIGGGSGTTEPRFSENWTFDRVGRSANNAVCLLRNAYNAGTFKPQARDHFGIGYDGSVSLLVCQGKATGTFVVPASGLYRASFRIAGLSGLRDAQILVDGTQVASFAALSATSFMRYEVALPWLAAGEHTFTFSDLDPAKTTRILFDDVKIVPVEPRDSAPVPVAIANPSFEQPWSNLAGALDDVDYQPARANCTGWTMPADATQSAWAGKALRRRWYDGVTDLANGLGANPDEMPDGFLCTQIYSTLALSQDVSFPSAGRYRLTFHLARRCGLSPQTVVVTVGDAVVRKAVVRHDEFRRYEAVFDLASGGTKTLRFAGTSTGDNAYASGGALLDAIALERVSETIPESLVANGTFENGATGWSVTGNAKLVSNAAAGDWVFGLPRTPLNGAESVVFNSTGAGALRQTVSFPAAGRYELSFRCQTFDTYPDDLTKVNRFFINLNGSASTNHLHFQATFDDGRERVVTIPFAVAEAGTAQLEFFVDFFTTGGKANVIVDDVAIAAAPEPDRTDLARFIPADESILVSPGATLRLDYDGVAKVSEVRYGGRRFAGEISHDTHPEWVMGRGRLYAPPPAFVLIVR